MRRFVCTLAMVLLALPSVGTARTAARKKPAAAPASVALPAQAPAPLPSLPADSRVEIEFLTTLSSASSHRGDMFPIRLAEPLMVGGQVLLPAGALGVGEVVEAKPAGGAGTPGVLILAARYLDAGGGQQLRLRALQQTVTGRDSVGRTNHEVWRSTVMVVPSTLIGMAGKGGNLMVPAGARTVARTAAAFTPGQAEALVEAQAAPARAPGVLLPPNAALSVPAPPPGMGQVVFFRPGGLSWAAIGCTVREDGHRLSGLGAGRWFAMVARPGTHTFRVTGETHDELRLNVEAGETQYVQCRMRSSILIARPFISPVEAGAFHRELADLAPVPDTDIGPATDEGQVLRRDEIRMALAERGDVRGHTSPDRAELSGTEPDILDKQSRRTLMRSGQHVLKKAINEATR